MNVRTHVDADVHVHVHVVGALPRKPGSVRLHARQKQGAQSNIYMVLYTGKANLYTGVRGDPSAILRGRGAWGRAIVCCVCVCVRGARRGMKRDGEGGDAEVWGGVCLWVAGHNIH